MTSRSSILIILISILALSTHTYAAPRKHDKAQVAENNQRKFDYYFYDATICMNSNEPDRALLLLQQCVDIDPDNAAANAMLGEIYIQLNEGEKAYECVKTAAKQDPSNWDYQRRYIEFLLHGENVNEAIKQAKLSLKYDQKNEDAYSVLEQLYLDKQDYKQAITILNKLEKITGVNEFVALEKLQIYVRMGQSEKGINEIYKLIEAFPESSQHRVLLGRIYMDQKNFEQAYEMFQEVLRVEPENPLACLSLIEYYNLTSQPDKAFETITAALSNTQIDIDTKIKLLIEYSGKLTNREVALGQMENLLNILLEQYPLEEQVHSLHAIALEKTGRIEEAKKALWTMLDINPKNSDTWNKLLGYAINGNNTAEILTITEKALEVLPGTPEWYFYRAITQMQQGDYETALQTNLSALQHIPSDKKMLLADFYIQIADLYYQQGDKKNAYIYYEKAYILAPQNLNLLNNYAYHLSLDSNELKKAERMSAITVEKEPQNMIYLDTYAWIFYKQDNISLAKFYIERAVDNIPEDAADPEIWEH